MELSEGCFFLSWGTFKVPQKHLQWPLGTFTAVFQYRCLLQLAASTFPSPLAFGSPPLTLFCWGYLLLLVDFLRGAPFKDNQVQIPSLDPHGKQAVSSVEVHAPVTASFLTQLPQATLTFSGTNLYMVG